MTNIQMLKCPACGEGTLHPKRKELGFHVCVNCSTSKPVVAITTVEGTGDHTWNDIIIMDQDKAASIARKEAELTGRTSNLEMLDFDKDEEAVSQSLKEKVYNVLEDEKEDSPLLDLDELKEGIEGIDY